MRRPSLQFYPGDWQSNPKLRRCSHAEKGIWVDVLCVLHDQDEYGIIRWPLKDLAIAVHAKPSALQALVDKGVLKGADVGAKCEPFIYRPRHGGRDGAPVTLIEAQDGPLWYSSRMVRDEHVRLARSLTEPKPKGRPKVGIGTDLGTDLGLDSKSDPSRARASSSSSTSTSEEKKERRADKPRDPRTTHPAIVAVREVKGKYPDKDLWDRIIEVVGEHPDITVMRKCWVTWRTRGFQPGNYGWLVDWYVNGIQGEANGTNRSRYESSSERNVRNLRANAEYIRRLSDSDSEVDSKDPIGVLVANTGHARTSSDR